MVRFILTSVFLTGISLAAHAAPTRLADELTSPADFTQGLDLFYGFNDTAARHAFARASVANADCALCYWGVAQTHVREYLLTEDLNDRAAAVEALRYADQALSRHGSAASMLQRALVETTYVLLGRTQMPQLTAHAATMATVYARWPNHPDVGALYGLALLGQSPSCHWIGPTHLRDDAPIFHVLEHVLRLDPKHVGAHHFYIHARERSYHPELALGSARALPVLAPELGHLLHMPSHIYLAVGDYAAAAMSNVDAIAKDDAYFATTADRGVYYDLFYLHNHHFLWSAQMMLGQRDAALATARRIQSLMSEERMKRYPLAHELFAGAELLTHVRFGDWEGAQAAERPDGAGPFVATLEQLAHGLAAIAHGDLQRAHEALAAVDELAPTLAATRTKALGTVARLQLAAAVARSEGAWDRAESMYLEAIGREDHLPYAEPWLWQVPTRDVYAEALLQRGNKPAALAVCRAELARHPNSRFATALCARAGQEAL